jgi:hypothetical protein
MEDIMVKPFTSRLEKRIRSNRARLFLAASVAVLAAIAFTLASVAANDATLPRSNHAQASQSAAASAQVNKTYTLYSGFWRTDGSFVHHPHQKRSGRRAYGRNSCALYG